MDGDVDMGHSGISNDAVVLHGVEESHGLI